MGMPTYRVTERRLEEYLGEPYLAYFNPFRSSRFVLGFSITIFIFLLFSVLLAWVGKAGYIIGIVVAVILGETVFFFAMREQFRADIASKMRDLVNDPGLLWLNSKLPEETVTRWDRKREGVLPLSTLRILAYLKKEGTSQGLHRKIPSMKNSSSARRTLMRLAEKKTFDEPIVTKDFKYAPWKFVVVDEKNHAVKDERVGRLLKRCWEEMLDGQN